MQSKIVCSQHTTHKSYFFPHHVLTTVGQLSISQITSLFFSSRISLYHWQLSFFFFRSFFLSTTLGTPKIYFHISAAVSSHHYYTYQKNMHLSECWLSTGKSLATSLSMWQTKGLTSMKNSSLRPSPRNRNGGTYFIFQIVFLLLLIYLREIPAVCKQTCLFFSGAVLGRHV